MSNRTKYKTLDRLAKDPRVIDVWDEGEDGIWVELADGYNRDGCSCLHEWTCKDLWSALACVEVGDPY